MQDFSDNKDIVKVIRKRKMKKNLLKCGFTLPLITYFSLLGLAFLKVLPFARVFSSTAMILCPFNMSNIYSDDVKKKTDEILKEISEDVANAIDEPYWRVYKLGDITIVSGNIQVGMDNEAINMVPIYKKGKYIVMHGNHSMEILAQYKENGKNVVKILEEDEVEEVYQEFDERTKRRIEHGNNILSLIRKD